ncbi:MAG: DUF1836 domain-containing protein [Clostridia bacterium]|nr:DUF1836 domain-containing protein [Clostridia bacterium]
MKNESKLKKQAEAIAAVAPPSFEELPDLGLYMDQVTGYLGRHLRAIAPEREDAILTPSMVNNYVKNGHIDRPVQKKYSREQLAALYMLCSLKSNLSIPDAAALVRFLCEEQGNAGAYNGFIAEQKQVMAEVAATFDRLPDEARDEDVTALAHDLIQRACAERLAAEALIAYLSEKNEARLARQREQEEKERAKKEAVEKAKKAAEKAEKAAEKAKKPETAEKKKG